MKRAGGFAAVTLLIAGAFLLGFYLTRPAETGRKAASGTESQPQPRALVHEVRSNLTRSYYRWIGPAVLRKQTVDGMLDALDDPHTDYLSPAEFAALRERTAGSYSGIGLTVGPSSNGLVVTSASAGPARKAGIRKGDVIVRVDGRPAGQIGFERSLALIKGEEGTRVRLTVKRPEAGTMEFTVVRQEIELAAVRGRLVQTSRGRIAYIRVSSFPTGAAQRLARRTSRLVERGARGAVLDLRDNPGGLLSQAVATVSLYLAEGLVCKTQGVHQEVRSYSVTGDAAHPRLPLVVLVNRGTASAAEVVAAALGEHRRASVIGARTFGKASVQSIEPLSNGGALKLTTATYVTPFGEDITDRGVRPRERALDDPSTPHDEALGAARKALIRLLAR